MTAPTKPPATGVLKNAPINAFGDRLPLVRLSGSIEVIGLLMRLDFQITAPGCDRLLGQDFFHARRPFYQTDHRLSGACNDKAEMKQIVLHQRQARALMLDLRRKLQRGLRTKVDVLLPPADETGINGLG